MKRKLVLLSFTMLLAWNKNAQPPKTSSPAPAAVQQRSGDPWKAYRFFLGKWSGDGWGPAGRGPGTMNVATDLDDSILKIENQVDFSGNQKKTTYRGTMIVSRGSNKALFLDNEGHVLHYTVSVESNSISFLSDPEPSSPRFRLTYQAMGNHKVKSIFDIAPLDTPNNFKIHVTGEAARQQ